MSVCKRLCIDDMCRGNPDNTLCGGCYCSQCHDLVAEEGDCDDCRPSEEDFYDADEDDTMKDGYA